MKIFDLFDELIGARKITWTTPKTAQLLGAWFRKPLPCNLCTYTRSLPHQRQLLHTGATYCTTSLFKTFAEMGHPIESLHLNQCFWCSHVTVVPIVCLIRSALPQATRPIWSSSGRVDCFLACILSSPDASFMRDYLMWEHNRSEHVNCEVEIEFKNVSCHYSAQYPITNAK